MHKNSNSLIALLWSFFLSFINPVSQLPVGSLVTFCDSALVGSQVLQGDTTQHLLVVSSPFTMLPYSNCDQIRFIPLCVCHDSVSITLRDCAFQDVSI